MCGPTRTDLDPFGFDLSGSETVGGLMVLLGVRDWKQIAVVSLATTFVVWLIFAKLLMLTVPMGIFENAF